MRSSSRVTAGMRQAGSLTMSTKDLRGMHTFAEDKASLPVRKFGILKRERKPVDADANCYDARTSASGMQGRCRRLLALTAVVDDGNCTCSFPAIPFRDTLLADGLGPWPWPPCG